MSRYILKLSSHLMERYEVCPRMFNFTTNLLYGPKGEHKPFKMGKYIHKILNNYYLNIKEGQDIRSALDITVKATESIIAQQFDLTYDEIDFGLRTFKEYVGYYIDDPLIIEVIDSEKLLSQIVYEDDEIVILYEGTPDLIFRNKQGDIFPMDHKTESAKRNVSGLNNQFLGYVFLTKIDTIYRNAIGLQKTKAPADKFYREPFRFPQGAIESWKNNIILIGKKIIEAYKTDVWEGHYSQCETNPIDRTGCIFAEVCRKSEVNWAYELETEFEKLEGLYYK